MKLCDIHLRDPFILPFGGKYYLYSTSGKQAWNGSKGFYCAVSDNLEDWTEPKMCFDPPKDFWATDNFWAPEVHIYKGSFYMFASFIAENRCRGTQILKSSSPMGPFLPITNGPVTPKDWHCLDGTFYVENGKPYMIFCHEWTQIGDGEICAVELSDDLTSAVSDVITLFKASQPKWACGIVDGKSFVTDGPFVYRTKSGKLMLLWSSFCKDGYCEAISYSDSGSIYGKWLHEERLLFEKNGGHGMIFTDNNGKMYFVMHRPNESPNERPCLFEIEEKDDSLYLKSQKCSS